MPEEMTVFSNSNQENDSWFLPVSLREVSERTSYSLKYLLRAVRDGKLKAFKSGDDWLTTWDWFDEFNVTLKQSVAELLLAAEPETETWRPRKKNIFWSCWQQELDHWLALAALLGAVLWLAALWNFPESLSVKKQILARSVAGSVNAVFQGVNNQVSAFGREVWSDAQLAATAGWQAFWLSGDRFAGVADEAGKLAWQLKEQKINDEKLTLAWQEIWPAPNSGQVAGASASAAGDYSEERPVGWGGSLWEQVKQVLGWH